MELSTARAPGVPLSAGDWMAFYRQQLGAEFQPPRLARLAAVTLQFALIVAAIRALNIETQAFEQVLTLALGGFLVHHFLPAAWRLAFFAALSVASVLLVLGLRDGAWLLGLGGGLIALCHLPLSMRARIALVVAAGSAMAIARVPQPDAASAVPAAIWPVLGAMFMFRVMIYLYDLKHRTAPFGLARAAAYFFMLPNVCFPLFPIVDYKTFQRSAYNDDALRLYQTGTRFMLRGLLQLLIYKAVYYVGVIEPGEVTRGLHVGQYMVVAYVLYLKISGLFHLVVGLLHMYGFGLQATHHLWLLASSFTDLWRRANIYWKDFMQKLVFNPVYFALRKQGELRAVGTATFVTAVLTWFLHSYQWFWIRGDAPFGWADTLFWAGLGIGLTINTVLEARKTRTRSLQKKARTRADDLALCLKTAGMFVTIIVLWAMWSTPQLGHLAMLWKGLLNSGPLDIAVLLGVPLGLGVLRVALDGVRRDGGPDAPRRAFWPQVVLGSVLAAACVLVALRPAVVAPLWPGLATLVSGIREGQLNAADMKKMQRGYYEDLADVTRFNNELWLRYGGRPKDWADDSAQSRERDDAIGFEYVPSTSAVFKGALRTINSLGMRDREYSVAPPPGAFRIALVGVSVEAGSGVKDAETYENVAEDRLNRELGARDGRKYEILNFSHGGYSATQKLAVIERRVLGFKPDVIVYVAYSQEVEWVFSGTHHLLQRGLVGEFPFVARALERAGVPYGPGAPLPEKVVLLSQLAPHAEEAVRAALQRFGDTARAHGVRAVLLLGENLDDGPEAAARVARLTEIGRAAGLTVISMYGTFAGVKDRRTLWIAPWDTHMNAEGHRLAAERFYAQLVGAGIVPTR